MQRDSISNTIIMSLVLCLICSLLVSMAAIGLKPVQSLNEELDRKKNLLEVTGFSAQEIEAGGGVEALFTQRFETQVIDLETGELALDQLKVALAAAGKNLGEDTLNQYDQFWASKSKKSEISDQILPKSDDVVNIKYREKFSHVFVLKSADGKVAEKFIFPVRGYGLWSMMRGYLAVEPDFQTVAGLTFYDQKETPGLGGEVQNPKWKAGWNGKKVFDPQTGSVKLSVIKGAVNPNSPDKDYEIDGLSGATITSNGVSKLLDYWLGPKGFGNYIKKQKAGSPSVQFNAKEPSDVDPNGRELVPSTSESVYQSAGFSEGNHG